VGAGLLSYPDGAAARAAAAFDARTLMLVFGENAIAEAERLALSGKSFGHLRRARHWRRVARELRRRPLQMRHRHLWRPV
jgi:hypothetical protein